MAVADLDTKEFVQRSQVVGDEMGSGSLPAVSSPNAMGAWRQQSFPLYVPLLCEREMAAEDNIDCSRGSPSGGCIKSLQVEVSFFNWLCPKFPMPL